jgi:hyperosmotically inducible protein
MTVLVAMGLSMGSAEDLTKPPEVKTAGPQVMDAKDATPRKSKPSEATPASVTADEPGKAVTSSILTAKLALMADPRLFPYDINVEMKGDGLTLSGKVPHKVHKAAAGHIARTVAKSVRNKLEIVKELDRDITKRQDEAITAYVKERFAKSKTLEKSDFKVKTEDGMVALSGQTRFQVILLEAAEAARQVPGVKAVKTDEVKLEVAN